MSIFKTLPMSLADYNSFLLFLSGWWILMMEKMMKKKNTAGVFMKIIFQCINKGFNCEFVLSILFSKKLILIWKIRRIVIVTDDSRDLLELSELFAVFHVFFADCFVLTFELKVLFNRIEKAGRTNPHKLCLHRLQRILEGLHFRLEDLNFFLNYCSNLV